MLYHIQLPFYLANDIAVDPSVIKTAQRADYQCGTPLQSQHLYHCLYLIGWDTPTQLFTFYLKKTPAMWSGPVFHKI
jgi:hypothetical protein